ncbi:MAG: 16S rRNA (guanine(527)-N(7))-methyltransferase RsmG [Planctomycetota bacterium]
MTPSELAAAGCDVGAGAYHRLAKFVRLLLSANQRVNLTAIDNEGEAWIKHICDSLALLPQIQTGQPGTLLDLGTGGGLPGIPLACVCPELQVTLAEATRKKLVAVERIVADLELGNVRCIWGRAETLAHESAYREKFDIVVARAVAKLRVLVEYASGFARIGGECWFFKSAPGLDQEARAAAQAARLCGLERADDHIYQLPESHSARVIVVYRKKSTLSRDLPREVGRPKKRPL